jgi:hypothetical protein
MFFSLSFGRFYGIDSLIELLIIIVAAVISLYSHKIYKLIQDKNYKFFSLAFLAIAISFIFKILSNFTIFYRVRMEQANFVYVIFSQLKYAQLVNFFSFILYNFFYLLGFLILFLIISKTDKKEKIFLFIYLSILAILLSIYFNFIFHITIVFILIFLTVHFYDNHKKVNSTNSFLVFVAFLIILASHLLFIFSDVHSLFYILGEALLLVGFMSLLLNHIKIRLYYKKGNSNNEENENLTNKFSNLHFSKGKHKNEENKTRGYKRHLRSTTKK